MTHSYRLWAEAQREAKTTVYTRTGGLDWGRRDSPALQSLLSACRCARPPPPPLASHPSPPLACAHLTSAVLFSQRTQRAPRGPLPRRRLLPVPRPPDAPGTLPPRPPPEHALPQPLAAPPSRRSPASPRASLPPRRAFRTTSRSTARTPGSSTPQSHAPCSSASPPSEAPSCRTGRRARLPPARRWRLGCPFCFSFPRPAAFSRSPDPPRPLPRPLRKAVKDIVVDADCVRLRTDRGEITADKARPASAYLSPGPLMDLSISPNRRRVS